jgi:hypothetical protein
MVILLPCNPCREAFCTRYLSLEFIGVPVGKDSEPSLEAIQPGWKHAQLLFEKKSLVPAVLQLFVQDGGTGGVE